MWRRALAHVRTFRTPTRIVARRGGIAIALGATLTTIALAQAQADQGAAKPRHGSSHAGSESSASSTAPPSGAAAPQAAPDDEGVAHYRFVILGGGTAAQAAYATLRAAEPTASIFIAAAEGTPYRRAAYSQDAWYDPADSLGDAAPRAELFQEPDTVVDATVAVDVDVERQRVLLADGRILQYDQCLLATGSRPRELPHEEACQPHVTPYRTVRPPSVRLTASAMISLI